MFGCVSHRPALIIFVIDFVWPFFQSSVLHILFFLHRNAAAVLVNGFCLPINRERKKKERKKTTWNCSSEFRAGGQKEIAIIFFVALAENNSTDFLTFKYPADHTCAVRKIWTTRNAQEYDGKKGAQSVQILGSSNTISFFLSLSFSHLLDNSSNT